MRLKDKRWVHLVHTQQGEAWYLTTNDTLAEMATYEGHVTTTIPYYGKIRTGLAQGLYRDGELVAAVASHKPTAAVALIYGTDSIHDIPVRE